MPAGGNTLVKVLYRALLRRANDFDRSDHLKFLISKEAYSLPEDLKDIVADFLGPDRDYYLPSAQPSTSVVQTVKDAFRYQSAPSDLNTAFAGLRLLNGICSLAKKHGLTSESLSLSVAAPAVQPVVSLSDFGTASVATQHTAGGTPASSSTPSSTYGSTSSSTYGRVELAGCVRPGVALIAHPLLRHCYQRRVVLACSYTRGAGATGVNINKPLPYKVKQILDQEPPLRDPANPFKNKRSPDLQIIFDFDGVLVPTVIHNFSLPDDHNEDEDSDDDDDDLDYIDDDDDDDDDDDVGDYSDDTDDEHDEADDEDDDDSDEEDVVEDTTSDQDADEVPSSSDDSASSSSDTSPSNTDSAAIPHSTAAPDGHSRAEEPAASAPLPSRANVLPEVDSGGQVSTRRQGQGKGPLPQVVPAVQSQSPDDASCGHHPERQSLTHAHSNLLAHAFNKKLSAGSELLGSAMGVRGRRKARVERRQQAAVDALMSDPEDAALVEAVMEVIETFGEERLFEGGPSQGIQALHNRRSSASAEILPPDDHCEGVFAGTNVLDLKGLMDEGRLGRGDLMLFMGEHKWPRKTLEREIESGMWVMVDADSRALHMFQPSAPPTYEELWGGLLRQLGEQYRHMAAIPQALAEELKDLKV